MLVIIIVVVVVASLLIIIYLDALLSSLPIRRYRQMYMVKVSQEVECNICMPTCGTREAQGKEKIIYDAACTERRTK